VDFKPVGDPDTGVLAARIRKMSELSGLKSLRFAVACSRECSAILCESLPGALSDAAIDLLIVDQNEPAGGTVAEHLGLPFISICPSLPLNREPDIPPPFVPWPYNTGRWARLRNRIGSSVTDRLIAPINKTVNRYRSMWGLPRLLQPDDSFSPIAQICQMTSDFDFPRRELPESFHYVGPFCDRTGPESAFPFERLSGKPLIYASLGTLQEGFPAAQIDLNNRALRLSGVSTWLAGTLKVANAWAWVARGQWDVGLTMIAEVTRRDSVTPGGAVLAIENYGMAVLGAWLGVTSPTIADQRRPIAV